MHFSLLPQLRWEVRLKHILMCMLILPCKTLIPSDERTELRSVFITGSGSLQASWPKSIVHAHVLMCVHMQVNNRAVGVLTPYFGLRPNGVNPYISIIDLILRSMISIIGIKNPILLNLKGDFIPLNPFLTLNRDQDPLPWTRYLTWIYNWV